MASDFIPAMVFPLGEYLEEELWWRGWKLPEIAERLGYSLQSTQDLLDNTRPVSSLDYERLAEVFGTSANYWRNLDALYQAHPDRQVSICAVHLIERVV